jgi:hypothetical protein
MSTTPLYRLFFEIVQMMGIRGYNIHPFKFLIDHRMKNERLIELGEIDKVVEFTDTDLIQHLVNYRTTNFGVQPELFQGSRMSISMIFDNPITGMRTLVLVSNETECVTSKDTIVDFISSILKTVTYYKTGGISVDPFLSRNKVNGIFILPSGVSPFCRTFLNELPTIKLLTENEVLSRCYDSVIQSHITTVTSDEKMSILEPVGLTGQKIPAINSSTDALCKILDLTKDHMMIATRTAIASEETITSSMFFRQIN